MVRDFLSVTAVASAPQDALPQPPVPQQQVPQPPDDSQSVVFQAAQEAAAFQDAVAHSRQAPALDVTVLADSAVRRPEPLVAARQAVEL